eukprot:5303407-Prymnesium_polylepis.1
MAAMAAMAARAARAVTAARAARGAARAAGAERQAVARAKACWRRCAREVAGKSLLNTVYWCT